MSSSLLSGVSGLQANQQMLDVIGNNLANVNTPGFKSQDVEFADVISNTLGNGTAPTKVLGGTDPLQVGLGVKVGAISTNLTQGSFQTTGRNLDLAIQGEGYFALNDGTRNLYTRVGNFDLDANNDLVDKSTGFMVQSVDGKNITIDQNAVLPAAATSQISLTGNLDASASPPAAEVVGSLTPFTAGTQAIALGSSTSPFALAAGDSLTIKADGGSAQTVTFQAGQFAAIGAATATEVAAAINSQVSGVTASVGAGNTVDIASNTKGQKSSIQVVDGSGSPATILGLSTTLAFGAETPANATTPLDSLPSNSTAYVAGDRISVSGTDANGTPVSASFVYGNGPGQNGTTLGDLSTFLGGVFPASNVAIGADGTLNLTSKTTGTASGTLTLADAPGNTGATAFSNLPFVVKTPGSGGGQVTAGVNVFDAQGRSHTVTLTFTKSGPSTWNVGASLAAGDGAVVDGSVQGLTFNDDGSYSSVTGIGQGDANLTFSFAGIAAPQTMTLNFGTSGKTDGLTQFGGSSAAIAGTQDGSAAGSLSGLSVEADGTISGVYTNGQTQTLGQVQVATFANPGGLVREGDNLLSVSTNSGAAEVGKALSGRAGRIESGVLEGSNVDMSLELTKLITAQSGYQVNARTITTTDQMLQELANLIR